MSSVHVSINPIKAYVREDVLYNMDTSKITKVIPCTIVGFSSYPGHVPTFQIIVDNSSIFYYIPPHLIFSKKDFSCIYDLNQLVYHNCPDHKFSLNKLNYLMKDIYVFMKHNSLWHEAKYLFTIDWYRGNDVLHCLILDIGQFVFMPNHKISLYSKELPKYLKLKKEFKV